MDGHFSSAMAQCITARIESGMDRPPGWWLGCLTDSVVENKHFAPSSAIPDRIRQARLAGIATEEGEMPGCNYLDGHLAAFVLDWLKEGPWKVELFHFVVSFLEKMAQNPFPEGVPEFSEKADDRKVFRERYAPLLEAASDQGTESLAIDEIVGRFGLDTVERRVVEFLALYASFPPMEIAVDALADWHKLRRVSRFSGVSEDELLPVLRSSKGLGNLGLRTDMGHFLSLKIYSVRIGMSDELVSYLLSDGRRPLSSFLMSPDEGDVLPLVAFDLPQVTMDAARAVLATKGSDPILLYGKPGTGKTELSRSLCRDLGLRPCFLKSNEASGLRTFGSLLVAARVIDPATEVLIVDEADDLLNLDGRGKELEGTAIRKSMVNEFLDGATAKMIFITNAFYRIPDSLLRRFSLHIGFENLGPARRKEYWDRISSKNPVFNDSERRLLAFRYRANPARIRQVVDLCSSIEGEAFGRTSQGNPSTRFAVAQEMLSRSDEVMYSLPRRKIGQEPVCDMRFLTLAEPAERVLKDLERWRDGNPEGRPGVNLLFYGAPGTGKTAFATWLASSLGMFPLKKKASDLLGPYVGMTEDNIRQAFNEAEGGVLIVDEADSFLQDRDRSFHSWEVSMVNELLTCMESFEGIFIATTNFNAVLDPACLRRFTYKLEFLPTAKAARFELVKSYFRELEWDDETLAEIEGLEGLCPGDVAVVARRLGFRGSMDARSVIDGIRAEMRGKATKMERVGF